MANEFLDFYRSTFQGQRDQVNAERKAEKAEAKAASAIAKAKEAQEGVKYVEGLNKAREGVRRFLDELRTAMDEKKNEAEAEVKVEAPADDGNTIEYTYKAGDTFGQVIKDLGLGTDAGLWGSDGDVAYYTQQLVQQGALDNRGNIPIGTKIRLRRRGAPEIVMSEEQVKTPGETSTTVQEVKFPELQKVTTKQPRLV